MTGFLKSSSLVKAQKKADSDITIPNPITSHVICKALVDTLNNSILHNESSKLVGLQARRCASYITTRVVYYTLPTTQQLSLNEVDDRYVHYTVRALRSFYKSCVFSTSREFFLQAVDLLYKLCGNFTVHNESVS